MFVTEEVHASFRLLFLRFSILRFPILLVSMSQVDCVCGRGSLLSSFISISLLNAFCDSGISLIFSIIFSLVDYLVILINRTYKE